ncbi:nicotinate-nucleotide adenylyltransferase [Tepidiforma sp.]|uniref:nicotinate-nucleotide adenylyltransferase n=1 Tax=Tepidiforma sp. TaxID=2682230 RepID=UPI002ADD384A|nr:nicotinate-nucleotide adenylyltransferase [Tepidiforma sp.]
MANGRVAVLGGTFDPPHLGHLVLGECARWQFDCERVLFVPAGDPYRKTGTGTAENARVAPSERRQVTPGPVRLALVEAAVAGNPAFVADGREVRRPGPSYTVDTLEELHREGLDDLVLVVGSDAAADLPNWREPGRIRELARVVVAEKPGTPVPAGFEVVEMPRMGVSSTLVRAWVREGRPIRYLVPEGVEAIIRAQGLYREG